MVIPPVLIQYTNFGGCQARFGQDARINILVYRCEEGEFYPTKQVNKANYKAWKGKKRGKKRNNENK